MAKDDAARELTIDEQLAQAEADLSAKRAQLEAGELDFVDRAGGVTHAELRQLRYDIEDSERDLLRLQADKSKAEKAARKAGVEKLAAEMLSHDMGDDFKAKAEAVASAVEAFVQDFIKRNAPFDGWRERMVQLGVPERSTAKLPSANDAMLAWGNGGGLSVGNRQFDTVYAGTFLVDLIQGVCNKMHAADPSVNIAHFWPYGFADRINTSATLADTYSRLEAIDAAQADAPEGGIFYRACEWEVVNANSNPRVYRPRPIPGGAVFRFAEAVSDDEQRRRGLIAITEAEARGDA